ncbi:MAG TPA: hypothetical protein VHV83_05125 [Armatimonadota bacterium]|nr:hypothetical protein [Armatimonadota bacterium]
MIGHGEKLSRKQDDAIAALLTQPTLVAAAKSVGIGTATLSRWMRQPAFLREYLATRREMLSHATGLMSQACHEAVGTLREVMNDRELPANARVAAARAILDAAQKSLELDDLAVRLSDLETKMLGEGNDDATVN